MRKLMWLVLVLGLLPRALAAQEEGVRLRLLYQPQYQPGLVVLPFTAAGADAAAAGTAHAIVRQDLDYSDRFQLKEGTLRPGEPFNARLWKERGADWVVRGELRPRPGGLTLKLSLHDVVYGQLKGEGEFELPPPGAPGFRMAVHAASDELVRWATGEPGAAATRIAFVMQGRGSKELYLVDYDGENLQRLTNDGSIALSPAWSPDGRKLAYTSFKNGTPRLYERDLAGGRERVLSDRAGINITPSYSPDGRLLAFATTVADNTEVATLDVQRNCCLQQHTRGRRYDSLSPSFSPDGRRFAFVSNRLGEPHVFVMPVGGGEARLVSVYVHGKGGYNTSPEWSPKGTHIVFHTRIAGQMQLAIVGADGSNPRQLTNSYANEDPSWAPNGRHVVFASPDRDGGGLFVLDTVSGRIRSVLRGRGYGLPAWSGPMLRLPAQRPAPVAAGR